METYEFWREHDTGEVWAVRLVEGAVVGCCGPLDQSEVEEEFLPTLDYTTERAGWVDEHRDAFVVYELIDV